MLQDEPISDYSSISGFKGDVHQMVVIARNEIKKFLRGNRILIFSVLIIAILALMTAIPYLLADGYEKTEDMSIFIAFVPIIVELAVVLFTATSIVSEFEERTALILFTKPVRKRTIFLGKLLASIIIVFAYSIFYYLYVIVLSMIATGGIPSNIGLSLGISLLGAFGCSGIAMLMSSLFKKGSTASIMTLFVIMLLLSMVASMLNMTSGITTLWSLDTAFGYCSNVLTEAYNMTDVGTACGVLVAYGIICNFVAYLFFSKRDF